MTLARRGAAVLMAVGVAGGAIGIAAPQAQAATCVTVPASTPGTNLTIAGEDHRVPAISNVSVCASDGSIPLVDAETSGGYCDAACLAIVVVGSDVDSGGITISYRADGVTTSRNVDPGGVGGPGESCLLGVGAPEAPRSDCFFAIEPDPELIEQLEETAGQTVEDAEDAAGDLQGDVGAVVDDAEQLAAEVQALAGGLDETACDAIPDQPDPSGWGGETDFCTDPQGWVGIIVENLLADEVEEIRQLVDDLRDILVGPINPLDLEWLCDVLTTISCA